MRRKDREVTDFAAMVEIVKACGVCRLGMQDGEGVYMVPLNFGYAVEQGQLVLYFHGADAGKKLALIAQNPAASFEMGHRAISWCRGKRRTTTPTPYRSVMGRGSVELLEGRGRPARGAQPHHGALLRPGRLDGGRRHAGPHGGLTGCG